MHPASLRTLRDPNAKTTSGFHFASKKSVGLHPIRGSHCICAVCIPCLLPLGLSPAVLPSAGAE